MNRSSLADLGLGLGLRSRHYAHILEHRPPVDWFEIISDNYLNTRGRPLYFLDRVAEQNPVAMHGVSLSIGASTPLDLDYVRQLETLRDRVGARWASACMSSKAGMSASHSSERATDRE